MQASNKLLCVSLILCGLVTQCFGLGIMAMDKRGWTLNSAGYLLGPNASKGYRNLNAKGGLAGKRDNLYQHDNPDFKTLRNPINERALRRLLQALAYKEGERIVLDNAAVPFFSEDTRKA